MQKSLMNVRVYRNLHASKKSNVPTYSVQDKKTRRVVAHVQEILLADVRFTVSQAGRARVLRENRKNVHAFVDGQWVPEGGRLPDGVPVTYDPYKFASFVLRANQAPIYSAPLAHVGAQGVHCSPPPTLNAPRS